MKKSSQNKRSFEKRKENCILSIMEYSFFYANFLCWENVYEAYETSLLFTCKLLALKTSLKFCGALNKSHLSGILLNFNLFRDETRKRKNETAKGNWKSHGTLGINHFSIFLMKFKCKILLENSTFLLFQVCFFVKLRECPLSTCNAISKCIKNKAI